jgi:acyl-CoA thioesterase FadM
MGDSAIVYKAECFYGDELLIEMAIEEISVRSFDFYYKISKQNKEKTLAAIAKTGMVCFNYKERKTVNIPIEFIDKINLLKKSI